MDELNQIKASMRENIPEEEFWQTKIVSNYFTDFAKATINRYGSDFKITVVIEYNPDGNIAYTTFNKVVLNAACSQVKKIVQFENKILYLKGLLAHEMSHIIYMDKSFQEKYFKGLARGVILPRIPKCNGNEKKLVEALKEKGKSGQIISISKWIINILEDGYGENTYLANYYGSLAAGMQYMRKEFYKDLEIAERVEQQLADDDPKTKWQGVCSTLLVYALYHRLKGEGSYPLTEELLSRTKSIIDKTLQCDFKERVNLNNELIIELWDYIEPMLKSNEKEDNKPQMPSTNKPEHGEDSTRPIGTPDNIATPEPDNSLEQKPLENSSSIEDIFEEAVDEIARKRLEQRRTEQKKKEVNEGNSYGCRMSIWRVPSVTNDMICEYEKYSDVLDVSRRMQKSIKQQLDDRRKGGKRNGLYFGRKVEVRQIIRNDGKCFYNNKLPTDIPRICVYMIIDESGSMSKKEKNGRQRIDCARETAIILEDFCRTLGFPICIIGTTADWDEELQVNNIGLSQLAIYASYSAADKNDRYRLTQIKEKGCNRDGAALRYAYNELKIRPEEIKILFIISDGKPNAHGYGGQSAVCELQELHEKCKRAGIVTFAAAVGDDKKQIEGIYGDSFLDISDLDTMPKMFVERIKKFIKR